MKRKRPQAKGDKANVANVALGQRLRALRRGKLTGHQLAQKVGASQATVSKIETGTQRPSMEYLLKFAHVLGLSKQQTVQLLTLGRLVPTGFDDLAFVEVIPFDYLRLDESQRRQRELQKVEGSAQVIKEFAPDVVPGLLQTETYARSVIKLAGLTNTLAIERGVKARLRRQRVLDKDKEICVLITEGTLRTRVCSNSDMLAQLDHIRAVMRKPNVQLAIIPWVARLTTWLPPGFTIYDDRLAYVELPHGVIVLRSKHETGMYVGVFKDLHRAAVFEDTFLAALDRIGRDYLQLEATERGNSPTLLD